MNILIVDDHVAIRTHLQKILIKKGYEAITAANGQEALEKAEANSPDLIILDVKMPVMNGFEALKQLKNSEKTSHIPVIMLTGMNDQKDEDLGVSLGAIAYIKKPVKVPNVLALLQKYTKE